MRCLVRHGGAHLAHAVDFGIDRVAVALAVELCVFLRRDADIAVEGPNEVGVGLETGFFACLLDIRALAQKLLGGDDAELNHILHDRKAGSLFKNVAEIVFAQHEVIGELVERQVLGAVLPKIIEYRLHAVIVLVRGAVLLLGGTDAAAD